MRSRPSSPACSSPRPRRRPSLTSPPATSSLRASSRRSFARWVAPGGRFRRGSPRAPPVRLPTLAAPWLALPRPSVCQAPYRHPPPSKLRSRCSLPPLHLLRQAARRAPPFSPSQRTPPPTTVVAPSLLLRLRHSDEDPSALSLVQHGLGLLATCPMKSPCQKCCSTTPQVFVKMLQQALSQLQPCCSQGVH
jgi:hypothetical protein